MAMGGNVTHCEKRITRQVRILFTTPSFHTQFVYRFEDTALSRRRDGFDSRTECQFVMDVLSIGELKWL